MAQINPMPADSGDQGLSEERDADRVLEDTGTSTGDLPAEEGIDTADMRSRVDLDPEEQTNATDPGRDPGEDAAG